MIHVFFAKKLLIADFYEIIFIFGAIQGVEIFYKLFFISNFKKISRISTINYFHFFFYVKVRAALDTKFKIK
jgi:hypothetical protein